MVSVVLSLRPWRSIETRQNFILLQTTMQHLSLSVTLCMRVVSMYGHILLLDMSYIYQLVSKMVPWCNHSAICTPGPMYLVFLVFDARRYWSLKSNVAQVYSDCSNTNHLHSPRANANSESTEPFRMPTELTGNQF